MKSFGRSLTTVVLLLAVNHPQAWAQDELLVAVASNFAATANDLAAIFEADSGIRVKTATGSTGKIFAQIKNGAPYDVFLAADTLRPAILEQDGDAVSGWRVTYAIGRLAAFSETSTTPADELLQSGRFHRLSIANPDHAPYGRAAVQVLVHLGFWPERSDRTVRGENVGQAFQFAGSGNADLGLVSASQLRRAGRLDDPRVWVLPDSLHDPIEQQAILIRDSEAGRAFLNFLEGPTASKVIRADGYDRW